MSRRARLQLRPLISLLLLAPLLCACSSGNPRTAFEALDLSAADAGSGEKLFNQSHNESPACAACHSVTGESSGIGNSLARLAGLAGGRVAGQSATEYLYWSILRPGQHLVPGYSNIMYADYEESLEAADLADLIAYLLTLH